MLEGKLAAIDYLFPSNQKPQEERKRRLPFAAKTNHLLPVTISRTLFETVVSSATAVTSSLWEALI